MEIQVLDQRKKRSKFLTEQEIVAALGSLIDGSSVKLCYVCTLTSSPRLQRDYSGFDVACIDDIAALRPMVSDAKYEIFEKRNELGNRAFALRCSGEIIGYRWLSEDRRIFPQDLCTHCLPANTAYAYDAFIHSDYRGQGLLAFLTAYLFANMGGAMGLSSYSEFGNVNALRAKERYGEVRKALALVEPGSAEVLKMYD